jgi:serine/threonine protein kinase
VTEKTSVLPGDYKPQTGQTSQTGSSISAWSTGKSTNVSSPGGSATKHGKPEAGAVIAQYEIIRLLGEGGMGAVYLGRDVRLGRRVAIKFLHATTPELTERFVIEARATARVEHENIVSIYEVGEWGGSPYMVLQFLQGQELTKIIPRGKAMPVPRVVEVMTPVLRALDYAHGQGIVHRDLKPDNIFITDGGVTKVLDFGIAKVVQGDDKTSDGEGKLSEAQLNEGGHTSLTRHGSIMGTMPYMSPEQWGNGVAIDHTSDIWAVGIMMYKMLSGKHPLHPLKGTELMVTGFVDEPMPSLREHAPELPDELIRVVDKALAKVKSERWSSAQALMRALEPFQPGRYAAGQAISVEESPYAGLSAFQEQDAARFFGRNREIAAMSQRLREVPLMAVVGSSGVGKSSFVRAGVVPALKNSGEAWEISVVRPGRSPLMALAGLLMQVTQDSGAATSLNIRDEVEQQQHRADRLRNEPGYFGTVLRRHARRDKKKLLIFVDQFEELYTLVEDVEERMAFTACLTAAADDPTSPMRVVVSIRSDFLDRCVEDVHFMNELSQGLFFMTAPTRDGMRDSLVLPAEMAGYKFESEGIVNDMLEHLAHTGGALPLLQFTADKLWSERDPARKLLTKSAYDALGGVSGALAAHADHVLAGVSGEHLKLVRALFLRLVTPDRTRAIVAMDDLREQLGDAAEVQRAIDQLVAARLLVVQTGGGGSGATVEIVHESLIHGWPQLRRWLDEGQEDAVFLEQLRNTSRQWHAKKRDAGLLWRGEMAEEAKRFTRRFRGELPEVQQQFLKAVIALSMRAARIRKTLLVAGAVVVSLLLAAAAVALYIINDSRQETERQAVAARQAEVRATDAASEAERRKTQAENALAEVKAAEKEKDAAREAESKALAEANKSREELAKALVDAQASEKKARDLAVEASTARRVAEQRAVEANAARLAATKANDNLQVALREVEQRRKAAELAKEDALRRLKEQTRGGVVEVLK